MCSDVWAAEALGSKAEQGEDLAQIHQALGLAAFSGQRRSTISLVQECLKALLHGFGEPKARQVSRHLELDLNGLSHEATTIPVAPWCPGLLAGDPLRGGAKLCLRRHAHPEGENR